MNDAFNFASDLAADDYFDFDKKQRQRKPRVLRWDSNERLPVDKLLLDTAYGYTLDVVRLLFGDVSWELREGAWLNSTLGYQSVVVERKTLADLRDVARLCEQLARLTSFGDILPILLIDHRFDTDMRRRWKENAVLNAELSIQFSGVKTTHCAEGSLAERLDSLYVWSQKANHVLAGETRTRAPK